MTSKTALVRYYKPVKGRECFDIFYNVPLTHKDHAPARVTLNGKIWEKKLFDIYSKLLNENDICIDIGAYIGTHTLPLSKLCDIVYAFEPNKELYSILSSNININQISNIRPYNIGVSSKSGYKTLYEREDGTSRISERNIKGKPINIEICSIDKFLEHLKSLKLLKIDVEGHEFEVLDGAIQTIKKFKPHILIEVFKQKRDYLYQWATNYNYEVEWLRGDDFHLKPI